MIIDRWKKLQSYIATKVRLGGVLPNDGYITGVPKNIFSGSGVGNVGTGLDTLLTFTFPAKSLKQDTGNFKDNFRIFLGFSFGANDDNKRVAVDFGGNSILDTGLTDIDGSGGLVTLYGYRVDATHVTLQATISVGTLFVDSAGVILSGGTSRASVSSVSIAVNNLDTNGNDLVVKGESATVTNDNVVLQIVIIDLVRF